MATYIDVVKFMLGKPARHLRFIGKGSDFLQRAIKAHFFAKSAMSRVFSSLAIARMPATGIGPQTSGVVLLQRPTLEQQPTIGVKHEEGESAVKQALSVCLKFIRHTDLLIIGINQNEKLIHYRHP
ncbi:hypothetical protein TU84_00710 [Pseudomonas helleri]|nr:hypothetical protein TU84_00710 [Pseudomonas helleri]